MPHTLPRRWRVATVIAGVALVAAACSSSGGSSAAPASQAPSAAPGVAASPTPSAAPSAAPSIEPTATPAPVPSPTPAASPSPEAASPSPAPSVAASIDPFAGLSSDKDLEARLPDSYGGATLVKLSFSGKDFPEDPDTTAYLKAIGKTYADLSVAIASGQSGGPAFIAMRVKGASEDDLKKIFQISAQQESQTTPSVKLTETSLDGVAVFKSVDSDTGSVAYFVVRGDTALGATGDSDAIAKKAFAALAK
jgi:hypothetical protein